MDSHRCCKPGAAFLLPEYLKNALRMYLSIPVFRPPSLTSNLVADGRPTTSHEDNPAATLPPVRPLRKW